MRDAFDRLRGMAELARSAARRIVGSGRWRPGLSEELAPILRNWGITRFALQRDLSGPRSALWLIETPGGLLVLRRLPDGPEWVTLQIRVMEHLRRSTFPYQIPAVQRLPDCSYFLRNGSACWLLVEFLDGGPVPKRPSALLSHSTGTLVGSYHRAMAGSSCGELSGQLPLRLFDLENTRRALEEGKAWVAQESKYRRVSRLLDNHMMTILATLAGVSIIDIDKVQQLEPIIIYNDWHRYNMVWQDDRIKGLIDFDSIAEAPRIVDFQNALTHILISRDAVDPEMICPFAQGYGRVITLSAAEVPLIYPVMIDRVGWLIAHVLDRLRSEHRWSLQVQATRLIRLLIWLHDNRPLVAASLTSGLLGGGAPDERRPG